MAKFTKLNIGESVASSGGRVWKKLSAESAVVEETIAEKLIGEWYLNAGLTLARLTDSFMYKGIQGWYTYSNTAGYRRFSSLSIALSSDKSYISVYNLSGTVGWAYTDKWRTPGARNPRITDVSGLSDADLELFYNWISQNGVKRATDWIAFTIDNGYTVKTYRAEKGMTWAQWFSSGFNTDSFSSDGAVDFALTDTIQDGGHYTVESSGDPDPV